MMKLRLALPNVLAIFVVSAVCAYFTIPHWELFSPLPDDCLVGLKALGLIFNDPSLFGDEYYVRLAGRAVPLMWGGLLGIGLHIGLSFRRGTAAGVLGA